MLVVFPLIFVEDAKIPYRYNFNKIPLKDKLTVFDDFKNKQKSV